MSCRLPLWAPLGIFLLVPLRPVPALSRWEYIKCYLACYEHGDRWDRVRCFARCRARRQAELRKRKNVAIRSSSSGYRVTRGIQSLHGPPGSPFTVDIDVFSQDPLERIELYFMDESHVPSPPDLGAPVGVDADGADGWSVTFDSAPFGPFSGVLLAVAFFPGHDPDSEGDEDAILCSTVEWDDVPPPEPIDLRPDSIALTQIGFEQVQVAVEYSILAGGREPPIVWISTDAEVVLNGNPVGAVPIEGGLPEVLSECQRNPPPNCSGSCWPVACAFVDLWRTDFDFCACEYRGSLTAMVRAKPGQEIEVELDSRDAILEGDEANNWIIEAVPGAAFHRGDSNGDGALDIADAIFVFSFLFLGGPGPSCLEAAEANNDGALDISDGISLLGFLFLGSPPPVVPGPPPAPCGADPDPPGSPGSLGCLSYERC
ncbi:MAG: hypothetical protein HY721_19205 [Planctomycetes bacterium]|nr:hypothetical protein [Planctomycetota bacterium]